MINRTIWSMLAILALLACQNQNASNSVKNNEMTGNSTITLQKDEPQMSDGLPPDADAVKTAGNEQATSNKKKIIYLKEGENKFLKEYEMNVTFKRITEDSRCPKDVQCIWQGNAMAEVELMGIYTRPTTITLSTMNEANKGFVKTQTFNGYLISLIEVSPETTSAKGFKSLKGSYKIALQFEKENPDDPEKKNSGATRK